MAQLHTERVLHDEIIDELEARGWLRGQSEKYDKKHALYPQDLIAWLKANDSDAYAKATAMHNGDTDDKIIERLVTVRDKNSTIHILRNGVQDMSASFSLCAFPPNSGLNPEEAKRYNKVILRVVPELKYSESNENRLDLAFFVNGIAVATAELKTDNTQSIDDAVKQYCTDRPIKDPKTKKIESLFAFKTGAIVHFAVSSSEVRMTTKLDGAKTVFLPFNRGDNGGAGNPPGSGINYLWEQILDREAWLGILGQFVCIERKKKIVAGKTERREAVLFPRYHQWDSVRLLTEAVKAEGPGQKYLIQHSAGSGKSNSIMWLAHRLAHLHSADDAKIFDMVFVLTDRTVLDDQLSDTVRQFDHAAGSVARIDGKGASKSAQLATALNDRSPIVIVTLQTFPFVMKSLGAKKAAWKGRKFAVIADEAHSSQSGSAARQVRDILGMTEKDGAVGTDDVIAARMAVSADSKSISYFAFTATPKPKTLQMFGRAEGSETPQAFHTYSMRQAIEEGFILDVLRNYLTWSMAYKVAKDGEDYDVPKGEAAKLIAKMAQLHSYTISQKVAIIVEHFRETVGPLLTGHAKAMIVTNSREAAVRYKKQTDKYISEKGYVGLKTLVAFSGDVTGLDGLPGTHNESNMNDLKGMDIPEGFETDAYQVLIVAEKYQTGFDQPLLCGMYVDKKLENVAAVQTLSRLNRTYHGPFGTKETTYVFDFVNDSEEIKHAFQQYFETATIDEITDPNAIHDLINAIDSYGVPALYSAEEIDAFVDEVLSQEHAEKQKQSRLNNLMAPVSDRFLKRLQAAKETGDSQAVDEAEIFRKNIRSFVRAYRFLSQIYNFGNVSIGKREMFYDWLSRLIRERQTGEGVDISGVTLTHLKITKRPDQPISLIPGESIPLRAPNAFGSAAAKVKDFGPLSEVIALLNEFFGSDVKDENKIAMIAGVFQRGVENASLAAQARNNPRDKFEHGDVHDRIKDWMTETYVEAMETNSENSKQMSDLRTLLSEEDKFASFATAMTDALYRHFNKAQPQSSGPASL